VPVFFSVVHKSANVEATPPPQGRSDDDVDSERD
jgi:hypothetical protein